MAGDRKTGGGSQQPSPTGKAQLGEGTSAFGHLPGAQNFHLKLRNWSFCKRKEFVSPTSVLSVPSGVLLTRQPTQTGEEASRREPKAPRWESLFWAPRGVAPWRVGMTPPIQEQEVTTLSPGPWRPRRASRPAHRKRSGRALALPVPGSLLSHPVSRRGSCPQQPGWAPGPPGWLLWHGGGWRDGGGAGGVDTQAPPCPTCPHKTKEPPCVDSGPAWPSPPTLGQCPG